MIKLLALNLFVNGLLYHPDTQNMICTCTPVNNSEARCSFVDMTGEDELKRFILLVDQKGKFVNSEVNIICMENK